jgi:hypothetical protein
VGLEWNQVLEQKEQTLLNEKQKMGGQRETLTDYNKGIVR